MRIIDRYILKHIIYGYIFVLILFIVLFLLADILTNLTDILKSKTPISIIIKYYFYMIPIIFKWVSPYALLISVLYVFAELNKNNEIISIRAVGISIFQLIKGVIYFSILLSFITFFIQENIILISQEKVEEIKLHSIKKDISKIQKNQDLSFSSGNLIVFARHFSLKDNILKDVTIFEEDKNGNILKKLMCKTLTYENEKWVAREIVEYKLNEYAQIIDKPIILDNIVIELEEKPKDLFFKKNIFFELKPMRTLLKEIKKLRKAKAYDKLSKAIIDFHQKIAEPFSHLFLIIGIMPFILEIKKRHIGLSSLGIGFIFGLIYYSFFYFSISLGKGGIILPMFSAWLTPIFFVVIGISGILFIR